MNAEHAQIAAALILLVEDDPAHAELIMCGFEDARVSNRIVHVADGEAALDYLFRRGNYADPATNPRPDLVLLDLHLPKVDGLEVLKEIKASGLNALPVIMLTSSAAEPDMDKAYAYHANSFLVKPPDFNDLKRLLDELIFYWMCVNQCPPKPEMECA